jgi:hypothetical protein
MIERYGASAVLQAAIQGNASLASGDVGGLKAWLKAIVAIEQLRATQSSEGETVH